MVGWHQQLDGHVFEQDPAVGDEQGSLACCSPWGLKELDTLERLNRTEVISRLNYLMFLSYISLSNQEATFCLHFQVKISLTNVVVVVQSLKLCPTLANPWTVASQAPLSMRFSRQEYWSGLPFPSPGDLPNPETKPWSPAVQADSLQTEL